MVDFIAISFADDALYLFVIPQILPAALANSQVATGHPHEGQTICQTNCAFIPTTQLALLQLLFLAVFLLLDVLSNFVPVKSQPIVRQSVQGRLPLDLLVANVEEEPEEVNRFCLGPVQGDIDFEEV